MSKNGTTFSTNVSTYTDSSTLNAFKRSLAGTRARVEEKDGKIFVIIDGMRVEADRNDLFGMNKSNQNDWLEHLIAEYDKEMAENKEELSFLAKMEESIKKAIKKVKYSIQSILSMCHVNSINKIMDEGMKNQALSLNNQKWNLTFQKTDIVNRYLSTCTDQLFLVHDKGKMVALNEAIA